MTATTTKFTPSDQASRDRILDSLDETLFVEAGAGTGKTTSLVGRIRNLIATGRTTLDRIASITFTEAAAAELRYRIREELEQASVDQNLGPDERSRCQQGVYDLDRAYIQTLHSFAAELLQERPLEAGLPPSFDIMDEIAGRLDFEDQWKLWLDDALAGTTDLPTLPLALSLGLQPGSLREIALEFHENHDLLAGAQFDDVPMPSAQMVDAIVNAAPELKRLCQFSKEGRADRLYNHVQGKLASITRLSEIPPNSPIAYRLVGRLMPLKTGVGRQADWDIDPATDVNACRLLKDTLEDLNDTAKTEIDQARQSALMPLLEAVKTFTLEYAERRKRQGRAGFQDLLIWGRDLLRDRIDVRDHFRRRFSHLLIDEAQDTDPIQAEIAMFLAEYVPDGTPDHTRPTDWDRVTPTPGRLFVVGDPKQSIYRFRRADVRQMDKLRDRMGGDSVSVPLVQNFRSHKPVLEWVNHLFGQWMGDSETQAHYLPVTHRWEVETRHRKSPAVWAIGEEYDSKEYKLGQVRQIEAAELANLLSRIVKEEWQVRADPEDDGDTETGHQYRPARFSDVCILMPTRTGLRNLEIALDDDQVPYRLEGASLIFATQEVRDLMNCLKAVDDPADQVSLVAALRSPAFACTDVELFQYHEAGGRFDYLSRSGPTGGRVAAALAALREYHESRLWVSTAELIDRFIRERPLMTSAVDHPRSREQWRRYRFVVEQARAFAEAQGGSLRAFIDWIADQADEGARVTEVTVPETDEESVRIMTIHGAKGLEFPIVILTGLNNNRRTTKESVLFDRDSGAVEVSVGSGTSRFQTPGYEDLADYEKAMLEDEHVRLMYVATTRAKDHLVLSLFHSSRGTTDAATITYFLEGCDHLWNLIDVDVNGETVTERDSLRREPSDESSSVRNLLDHSLGSRDSWITRRKRLVEARSHPVSVSATRLAQIAKDEAEGESDSQEPWRRGRAGTSIGRAVHAVLQTIDLATGNGIDETSRAQAAAEGIPQRHAEIARLARVAVNSDVVKRAVASQRLWREAPMAVPVGDGVLEGYIDLLFEEPDGLIIVDYKTDSVSPDQAQTAVDDRYRLQAGSYALMAQHATGRPVKEVVFLFLQPKSEQTRTNIAELAELAKSHATDFLVVSR